MPVTADELREWATKRGPEQSEVERRIVVSRHYYAAFHKCRPIAEARGIYADAGGSHREVIEALERGPDRKLKGIGYKLEECRKARVKADYRIEQEFTEEETGAVKEECERIWNLVGTISEESQEPRSEA